MQLRQACLQHGFFYLRLAPDQPDFQALRQAAIEQSRAFFALPMETKLETVVDENTRGFAPSLQDINETTRVALADRTRLGRWKESFFLGRDIPPTSPEAKDFMQGPNQWPDPCRLPFFRPTLESYFQLCHELGERLNELLALSLGLDRHFFLQEGYFDKPMLLMRLLHYQVPASAAGNGELVEVAAAHTDYGMVTILANDQEPGLQVWINGEWTNLPPIPGTLVVNLGDMLQKWSGDLYKSTRHREGSHRSRCNQAETAIRVYRVIIAARSFRKFRGEATFLLRHWGDTFGSQLAAFSVSVAYEGRCHPFFRKVRSISHPARFVVLSCRGHDPLTTRRPCWHSADSVHSVRRLKTDPLATCGSDPRKSARELLGSCKKCKDLT
eukprot:g52436.t1